jgi:hypothetical protein
MSNLSTKERKSVDLSNFGDPERRLFPVMDQDDVDSASHLIGKAKNPDAVRKRIIAIAKRKGLKIPDAWKEATMSTATDNPADENVIGGVAVFDLAKGETADGMVHYRNTLLFRPGDYPDQKFSMTPEELWLAAQQFEGAVPNELEHISSLFSAKTILDGKLGHTENVRLSDDGTELRGTVVIPKWLDQVWDAPLKQVSAAWDRADKTLKRVGLVIKGQIPDAALFSAYAAFAKGHQTYEGQSVIQQMHDMAARSGAVCSKGASRSAMFHSSREVSGIQKMHDMAVEHGAKCSIVKSGRSAMFSGDLVPKGKTMTALQKLMNGLFGSKAAEVTVDPDISEDDAQRILGAFAGSVPAGSTVTVTPGTTVAPATPAIDTAQFAKAGDAAALRAELESLRATSRRDKANAAAEKFIDAAMAPKAAKITPAVRPQAVALFAALAEADEVHKTTATFAQADGKTATAPLLDLFKAFIDGLPSHAMFAQHIPDEAARQLGILPPASKPQEMTPEREKELLSHTDAGRAALATRNGSKN